MAAIYSCPLWLPKPEFKPEATHNTGLFLTLASSLLEIENRKFSTLSSNYIQIFMISPLSIVSNMLQGVFLNFSSEFPCHFHWEYALHQRKLREETQCVMIGVGLQKALSSPVWKIAMPAKTALLLSYKHFRMTPWRSHSTKVKMISDGK